MFHEISAAVDHLSTLLHPAIDTLGFKKQVYTTLETRFANLWFPLNPTRASASRVLLWQAHGGGEGLDSDIRQACLNHCSNTLTDDDFFSSPFALWIDPGCVAIRLGHGPGLSFNPSPSLLGNFKTIYSRQENRTSHYQAPPMLAIIPSTPALLSNNNQGWSEIEPSRSTFVNYNNNNHYARSRSPSTSSMASSITGSRTTTSSYMSSTDDNEQCPSLSAQDSDSELSLEDMIDSGCYKNFDIIDDGDEEQGEIGDETITGDIALHLEDLTLDANSNPASIVNYDGGNVGVLGGGIRLGGKAPRMTSQPLVSPPALPTPNSLHNYDGFQFTTMMEGYAIPMAKRIRSRGRRSRGRGAGRAARRQAAAMEGYEQTSERDFDSNISTPDSCEDERIMAIVRQRADQVTNNLIKRRSMQNIKQQYYQSPQQQQHQQHQQHHHQHQQHQYAMAMHHNQLNHHQLPLHHHQLQSYHQSHTTSLYQSMN